MSGPLRGKTAAVVGGGLGGLAAALRLERAGAEVTLFERNPVPGGKLAEHRAEGFRWDMGPSLLTLPDVLRKFWGEIGAPAEGRPELTPIDPVCRYFWRDGTVINEDEAFLRQPEVAAFLKYAAGIYALSGEAFLTRPPGELWKAFLTPANWKHLVHLPKITTTDTLARVVHRRFTDPHLQQLFLRFATYNGSSPYLTPATFNVIPYVENQFGAWYVRGGMARLAEHLTGLARARGITLRTGTTVTGWDGKTVTLADGKTHHADLVLANGDTTRAYRDWVRVRRHEKQAEKLAKQPLSLSGFVLLLGVKHRYPQLSHHNIFFSEDYPAEFGMLFHERRPAEDPTIYISTTSRTDAADAPAGADNFFVLVNAPANTQSVDWTAEGPAYADYVVRMLEEHGLENLSGRIAYRKIFTPADFEARDLSSQGALYGWASHSPLTSLLRPPLRSPIDKKLYFAGGTTHPGGGIPLVLLSAQMATNRMIQEHGS